MTISSEAYAQALRQYLTEHNTGELSVRRYGVNKACDWIIRRAHELDTTRPTSVTSTSTPDALERVRALVAKWEEQIRDGWHGNYTTCLNDLKTALWPLHRLQHERENET